MASSIWACCCSRISGRAVSAKPGSAPWASAASTRRNRLGRSSWRLPRPMPTAWGTRAGAGPKRSASTAIRASPVGVVSSPAGKPSLLARGIPLSRASSSTAGAGRGRTPWAVCTVPWPAGGLAQTSWWMPKWAKPAHTPTTSTRASIAPTSWKWTRAAGWPWTWASASASRPNTASTLCLSWGSRAAAAIVASSSAQWRWGGSASKPCTARCKPRRPALRRSSRSMA